MYRPNREVIENIQQAKLRVSLKQILSSNLFYRGKLDPLDLATKSLSIKQFLKRCPLTEKNEFLEDQIQHPPFGRNLTFPLEQYSQFSQTSATRGVPLRWLDTCESWNGMLESWKTIFLESGVKTTDRIFFAFSFGPFLGFWTAFNSAQSLGCLCIPGGGQTSLGRLQSILENQVDVLCSTPTYALRLAEVAMENNLSLKDSPVRILLTAGEPGGCIKATRSRLEAAWGAQLKDHHGMTEVGPVSFECTHKRGILHIMENSYLAEVLDLETKIPIAPGATGELILTTLDRTGSPALRYRTGDLVQSSAEIPCSCGRFELALEGGILGRVDDMVVIRGVNLFPGAVEEVIRRWPEISEYQIEIHGSDSLKEILIQVELTLGNEDSHTLVQHLERDLHAVFSLRIPVLAVSPGTLPRFEMKAKRWICK